MKIKWWIVGYVITLLVALLSPLASGSPDGLERVAEEHQFLDRSQDAPYAVIADYVLPGVQNEAVATILAGFIGVTVVFLLVGGGTYLAYRLKEG